ncbi:indole-3-glycerol phosphate synthase TrpC [Tardisphaera miroshnichenkoae]
MPRQLSGFLSEIVKAAMEREPVEKDRRRPIYSLKEAIAHKKEEGLNPVIAEFKRSSPSGLRAEREPVKYAEFMEKSGAAALSILTEPLFFSGSYADFEKVASKVRIPLLFKDFVVTEAQIRTAYSIGADAVLLITKILDDDELCTFSQMIRRLGMTPLVEVESEEDIAASSKCSLDVIGVNARDLNSLKVSVDKTAELLKKLPRGPLRVAESGINERQQIERLKRSGADAFLIGTALMKDPAKITSFI